MTNLRTYILILGIINFSNADYVSRAHTSFQNISRNRRQTSDGSCKIPNNPPNGKYAIRGDEANIYKEGDSVEELIFVLYLKCEGTHMPSPPEIIGSFCVNGVWEPSPGVCSRTCKSIYNTETTEVQCSFNNVALKSCENPVEGTVAKFTCEPFYEESSLENYPYRFCENGAWDGTPHCLPICGQKHPVGRTNVINGTNAKLGDYPWHVGVYNAKKEYRCGGAIITQRIMLSAAHCFTNLANGELYPKENYLIAVGKYYRNYHDVRDEYYQYSTIDSINIPSRYKGSRLQYQADIAVVILTKQLILTEAVQPVCVDWGNKFENQQLIPNNHGVVTGWGYTMEGLNLSDELKELSIPFITFDQCYENVPRAFQTYLRPDKICAGYLNIGTSICEGDSGGALAFPSRSSGRYFIRGIVSTSPATIERQCDSNQYGVYTLVSAHLDFINSVRNVRRPYLDSSTEISPSTTTNISPSPIAPVTATSTNASSLKCLIPPYPLNGRSWVESASNDESHEHSYLPGDFADQHDRLLKMCHDEHIVMSLTSYPVCDGGSWKPEPTGCPDLPNLYLLPTKEVCGISKPTELTTSTTYLSSTDLDEFPWSVALQSNTKTVCGGILINNRYVLTVAHCLESRDVDNDVVKVRLGEYNFDTDPDCVNDGNSTICAPSSIEVPILEKIIHEDYNKSEWAQSDNGLLANLAQNDIGLIRLERVVDFTDYIKPVCLPTSVNLIRKDFDGSKMILAGWGQAPFLNFTKTKVKLRVPVFSNTQCQTAHVYSGSVEITWRHICAGGIRHQDLCEGSFGSALMKFEQDGESSNWYAFGILSANRGCGIIGNPNIYTRVTSYIPWIVSKLQP